jgi:hypothetical protein
MDGRIYSVYWGGIDYWVGFAGGEERTPAGKGVVDGEEAFRRGGEANRCTVAAANGALTLTVPVEKPPGSGCPVREIRVSEHGRWRHRHWQTLVSAYRRSPFFDYYAEDFAPFYQTPKSPQFLIDLNEGIRHTVCNLIGLDPDTPPITPQPHPQFLPPVTGALLTRVWKPNTYYQVFACKHGFIPHLSVADLLFNEGPLALSILQGICKGL